MKNESKNRGLWWIEGADREPLPGTLEIKSGEIALSVWKPQNASFEEVMGSTAGGFSFEVPTVIHGTGQDREPITLFACGVDSFSQSGGVKSWDISALASVAGLKIDTWTEPVVRAISIRPEFLHRWFGRRLVVPLPPTEDQKTIALETLIDLEFVVDPHVRVHFVDHPSFSDFEDGFKIGPQSSISFQFDDPRSLDEIMQRWIPWVSQLLGLLMGVPSGHNELEIFTADPYQESIRGRHATLTLSGTSMRFRGGRKAPHPSRMFAPFASVENKLAGVVSEWHRVRSELEPVVALFSAVALHHSLYAEARFLFLVQALEIYHACSPRFTSTELPQVDHQKLIAAAKACLPSNVWKWAGGKLNLNSRSLMQKLLDLFEAHPTESTRLFGDRKRAASRIAFTRNHLTHHYQRVNASRLMSDAEISEAGWTLEALLWTILLREIGLDGEPVNRVVARATRIRFVGLGG